MILYSGDCVSVAICPDFSSRMRGGQWFVARRALLMTTAASLPQMDRPCACFVPTLHPAWGPPRYGGGSSLPARLATCAAEGGGADHTGRPCRHGDTCQHAGMADGARDRVTHLGVSPDLQARAGLRVGTEVVKDSAQLLAV